MAPCNSNCLKKLDELQEKTLVAILIHHMYYFYYLSAIIIVIAVVDLMTPRFDDKGNLVRVVNYYQIISIIIAIIIIGIVGWLLWSESDRTGDFNETIGLPRYY